MRFFKSLKFRIILLSILLAYIPLFGVSVGFLHLFEYRTVKSEITSTTAQANLLIDQINTTGYINDKNNASVDANLVAMSNANSGRIIVMNNALKIVRDTYSVDEGKYMLSENVIKSAKGTATSYYDKKNNIITVTMPITNSNDTETINGVLLINVSTYSLAENMSFCRALVLEILLVLFIIILLASITVASRLTSPLTRMSKSIDDINKGIGSDELAINELTETAEISEKFNGFMSQMKMIDESRAEFVSNVSHELKTPLTSMKVLADSLNSMPDAPVELYQEFMQDIGAEIDRETTIINDLLSLVKLDKSAASLNVSPVSINELMEVLLKRLKPIAEEQGVELVLESFRPVMAEVDEVKFSLAIMNLIENGIKYNNPGGWVHVTINADHQYCYLRVEDSGMGIPEDSIDQIFERFYRVDKSHSREIGGTGLGLAITKNAILMHHGEIKVHSVLGEGTMFTVRVPLKYIEKEN